MNCKIGAIEYILPEKVVTNEDLLKENPSWDIAGLIGKTGVVSRHIAAPQETALDLAEAACRKLFSSQLVREKEIDALIFCSQSNDHILPANASVLHGRLGFEDRVFVFDINLACSGYIYGLALAKALLNTYSLKNILLVTADTYSKFIHPKDKSVRLLLGDGAAVSLIQSSERGILDIKLGSYGSGFEHFIIPAGGCRMPKSKETAKEAQDKSGNVRTPEHIRMEGYALLSLTRAKVIQSVREVLAANNLACGDIKLFVFHQASKLILESFSAALEIPPEKVYSNLERVGNMVSASIPAALKDALGEKRIKAGDKVLLCGFGAGFSWGCAVLEWN